MLTRGRLSNSKSESDQGAFENASIRMGDNYQVKVPDLVPFYGSGSPLTNGAVGRMRGPLSTRRKRLRVETTVPNRVCSSEPDRDISLWKPMIQAQEDKLTRFLKAATKDYGYNEEQALAMLNWHKKNTEHALDDLSNFSPMSDNWSHREKKKFFMAVRTQKKDFSRIKQMFPQRTMRELILFYYTNKKKRSVLQSLGLYDPGRCGLVQSLLGPNRDWNHQRARDRGEHGKKTGSGQDELSLKFERHMRQLKVAIGGTSSSNGELDDGWSTGSDVLEESDEKYSLPSGTHYQHSDFVQLAHMSTTQLEEEMGRLEANIREALVRVSNLQEEVERKDEEVMTQLNNFKPAEGLLKPTYRWTDEELLFTVQAVRKHGRDYRAIADLVGSKTEAMIRTFFNSYSSQFKLDQLVAEYEKERNQLHPSSSSPTKSLSPTRHNKTGAA